ncbi:MAG: hypothetical protein AAGJ52_06660 [Pseudomonadota bacterium]
MRSLIPPALRDRRTALGAGWIICLALTVSVLTAKAQTVDPIFSDRFEQTSAGLSCLFGPPPAAERDWGPQPAGVPELLSCLSVINDQSVDRSMEAAWSGVAIARTSQLLDTDLDHLVVLASGLRRVPAQFKVLSRWGGPLADSSLPVRWLEVTMQSGNVANEARGFALLRMSQPAPVPTDPLSLHVATTVDGGLISHGTARFEIDYALGGLLSSVEIAAAPGQLWRRVLEASNDDGPFLELPDGGGIRLDAAAGNLQFSGGPEWSSTGPVRTVISRRGHFVSGNLGRCQGQGFDYESLGFTVMLAFTRGSQAVDLEFHVRNECSQAFGGDFTDQVRTLDRAGWAFSVLPQPLAVTEAAWAYDEGGVSNQPSTSILRLEQARGGGAPWTRRALARADGSLIDQQEALVTPYTALRAGNVSAGLQQAFMAYREPMAIAVGGPQRELVLESVSEAQPIGEGKGLYTLGRLSFAIDAVDQDQRMTGQASLERGLLIHQPPAFLDQAAVYPPVAESEDSVGLESYSLALERLHQATVGPQWGRAKTWGSQLWPDVQFALDLAGQTFPSPADNNVRYNYWNASGAEHMAFLRTGDPAMAWDFALPQSWLQLHTAYLNTGGQNPGIYEGVAVQSGGAGDGQWHRSAFGSDDYSYNQGQAQAYLLRPGPTSLERLSAAGQMLVDRYSIPRNQQATRTQFLNQLSINRQVIQHLVMLANCAEFAPAATGENCHDRLMEILTELGEENFSAGAMCVADLIQGTSCELDQQFMQNSLHFPFFWRLNLNYGQGSPGLSVAAATNLDRMLQTQPQLMLDYAMPQRGDGSIDTAAAWAPRLSCVLNADRSQVSSCQDANDNSEFYFENYPSSMTWILLASDDPLECGRARQALAELLPGNNSTGAVSFWVDGGSGWWKGAAQIMQGLIHGTAISIDCQWGEQ